MKRLILSVYTLVLLAVYPATAQTDFQTLMFNHEIAIGMPSAYVVAAWGNPVTVARMDSDYSTEWWQYDWGWIVVLKNGRVVTYHSTTN